MGCNCSSSGPALPQPDAARWHTNVWHRGEGDDGDQMQSMGTPPNPIRFLPLQLEDVTVLRRQEDGSFHVDGSDVPDRGAGLPYCLSKSLQNKDANLIAKWGSSIQGEDLGDGWVRCDIDAQGLKYLKSMRSENLLEVLMSQKFIKDRSMVLLSENALPGVDGRWKSSKHGGVKTIQGQNLYWGYGMTFGITYLPMERLSYDHLGDTRKGMLAGNKIDWNDGDSWTRLQNDPFSMTETVRLGPRLGSNSIGFSCHKGLKPEIPNQDNWSIVHVAGDFLVYTVCDGHGMSGHHVADISKDALPRFLLQDHRFRRQRQDALADAFEATQDLLRTVDRHGLVKAGLGGTTATMVVHDRAEQKLQVGHVGDSTAILGRLGANDQLIPVQLTREHHLEMEDERKRIEATGARVEWEAGAYRAFNKHGTGAGLNVTRSLGDLDAHLECGIASFPEVKEVELLFEDKVLIVASDGVWTWMKPQEVLDILAACGAAQPAVAAERVAKEAYDRWLQETGQQAADDITVLVVDLTARDIKEQFESEEGFDGCGFFRNEEETEETTIEG